MELRQYIIPLRKWWWLLVATTLVSTVSAYVGTLFQDPQYQARSTLMIGQAIQDPNPNNVSIYLSQQLAQSYVDIAKRQRVREATMEELGLTWLPQYTARAVPNTQLLEITVLDTSPERAQAVANTLADKLVLQSPTGSQQEDQQRQAFISQQLDSLELKITETEEQISELQASMTDMISARQIADTQSQISVLQSKLTTLQTNYATLVNNTKEGAINSLSIIETAGLPRNAVGGNTLSTILLGAAIGFTLAAGAAYFMEYLDDTLKSVEEITAAFQVPIIGFIAASAASGGKNGKGAQSNHGGKNDSGDERVIVAEEPRSPIAEAYRTLRTNLEFAAIDRPLHTLLITSPNPSDGKTTVAANLAVIMAQAGKKVLLLDADMRRPRVHRFFSTTSNRYGLSDIFRSQIDVAEASQGSEHLGNLRVITSGKLPPDPAELLGSAKMDQILLTAQEQADIVVIDSPPFLVSDASVLAAKVDGVVLIVQPGRTTADAARAMMEQFRRADARIVGVVLNRIPRKQSAYYGGYHYYAAPYHYHSHYDQENSAGANGHQPLQNTPQPDASFLARLRRSLAGGAADDM